MISLIFKYIFAYLLNTYLIAASEKFQILKNGSDCNEAWPPLVYTEYVLQPWLVNCRPHTTCALNRHV